MKRAALYARFSSELQNERSVDDQLELCRAYCAREGHAVVAVHGDRAISGASVFGRHGLAALLADVEARRCDIVVVEALDRVSRDMGDLSTIWKRLQFAGVTLCAVHDGVADQVQIGVRGLVGALYLTDLAHKTKRGLAAKVRAGQRAGGLPYGYRATPGKPGESVVDEAQAEIVRLIFREYAAGSSPRTIAHRLNGAGIAPFRGAIWNASTITGNVKRCSGMLTNEIYRGEIVWNRVSRVKNPANGKRVPRVNPAAEWQRTSAPQLRIVDEDLWESVQREIARRRNPQTPRQRGPRRLLSGLLKCGECGGSVVSVGSDHGRPVARCARVRESGGCTNSSRMYLDTLEADVLAQLRDQLKEPRVISAALREFHAEMQRLAGERGRSRFGDERKLKELRCRVKRMVEQFAEGSLAGREAGRHLAELEGEADALETKLAGAATAPVVTLHPQALGRYIAAVEDLAATLKAGENNEALGLLRGLVERIVIHPRAPREPMRFDIVGKLVALLNPSVGFLVPPA